MLKTVEREVVDAFQEALTQEGKAVTAMGTVYVHESLALCWAQELTGAVYTLLCNALGIVSETFTIEVDPPVDAEEQVLGDFVEE